MIQLLSKYRYVIQTVLLLVIFLFAFGCNGMAENLKTPSPLANSGYPTPTEQFGNIFSLKIPGNCHFASISQDYKWIVMKCDVSIGKGSANWNIQVSTTSSQNWVPIFPEGEELRYFPSASFSPDGTLFAVLDPYNRVLIFKTGEWQNYQAIDVPFVSGVPIWSPDGQSMMVRVEGYDNDAIEMLVSLTGSLRPLLTWNDLFSTDKKPTYMLALPEFGPTW